MKKICLTVFFMLFIFVSCENTSPDLNYIKIDNIMFVSAGNASSYVISENGDLWAWGSNSTGQFGNDENVYYSVSGVAHNKVMENVRYVSASGGGANRHVGGYVLAIKNDNTLWAWGRNSSGELGIGYLSYMNPTPQQILDDVHMVSAGFTHAAAVKTDGSLWIWGCNCSGKYGDGTTESSSLPVKVKDNVVAVSAGLTHTAAILDDGSLWVWGSNTFGEIGDGTNINRLYPVKIMDNVVAVSASFHFTMAITENGDLWAWGDNLNGQLGNDTLESSNVPEKIMSNISYVSAGISFILAIDDNSNLWAWGDNINGQLGDGTRNSSLSPIYIKNNVISVSTGGWLGLEYVLAIDSNGALWSWGNNLLGQLGNGNTQDFTLPIEISYWVVR